MTPPAKGSIVIPAHNEESVIGRCLDALASDPAFGDLEVLVACNGCTDATAKVARSYPGVQVLEIGEASKAAALRAADEFLATFPRLYVDADIQLSGSAALHVIGRLAAQDGPPAARPPLRYDTTGASPLVQRYYRARARTPALMSSLWGAGVYGLSAAGRARFSHFPTLVADDLFVDRQFLPSEIEIVTCTSAVVRTPRSLGSLVAVLRRVYTGKRQVRSARGREGAPRNTLGASSRGLLALARREPQYILDATVYAGVAVWARASLRLCPTVSWARDDSSR